MQSNQVDRNCLQFIAINETITVEDVEVTALDAHKYVKWWDGSYGSTKNNVIHFFLL